MRLRRRKRQRPRKRQKAPPGSAPGTLVIDPESPRSVARVLAWGPDDLQEQDELRLGELPALLERWPVVWVDVRGLGDEELLRGLARTFGIHRLALEDVVSLGQRAKLEPYEHYLFLVARLLTDRHHEAEQISLFLGRNFIVTFQENADDSFERVRQRVRAGTSLMRTSGPDYLAYALLDAVIDSYFPVLEQVGDELDALEDQVLEGADPDVVPEIHDVKRFLVGLRRSLFPHRELINSLLRDGSGMIGAETSVYLRDCYDHAIRLTDIAETYREISSDLMATYLSRESNRMNEVMKVLTIIATIFIPLSFIAGVYGMNFDPAASPWNMPELDWRFGYPFSLGLMAATAAALVAYFWRKGWFR